jgi:hypothetical protein
VVCGVQGAANRKVAATNMNRESSRSHSVFTCVIESQVRMLSCWTWMPLQSVSDGRHFEHKWSDFEEGMGMGACSGSATL